MRRPRRLSKFAILVDKVMTAEAGKTTERWMVEEAKQAGFNVFTPRFGFDRPEEVLQVAQWCKRERIRYMPWMRGSLKADAPEAPGKMMVWDTGKTQNIWSPNSEELWGYLHRYVLSYAAIGRKNPWLMGVFLDFENYAQPRNPWLGHLYPLSYDEQTLRRFTQSKGIEFELVGPAGRRFWLETRGLLSDYESFQVEGWRSRARQLRHDVDAINPKFQLCLYPPVSRRRQPDALPDTPRSVRFLTEVFAELATERAPLILADSASYGNRLDLPMDEALQENVDQLQLNQETLKGRFPMKYIGGIDPVVDGATAEFSGQNAVKISRAVDGYWVFYEGPQYSSTHKDYWKWFAWANRRL